MDVFQLQLVAEGVIQQYVNGYIMLVCYLCGSTLIYVCVCVCVYVCV